MDEQVKKITKKEIEQATKTVEEFVSKLGITAEITVSLQEGYLDINLQTAESGILIGYHGETLESLQLLLSLAVSKKIGRFIRVMIDVGEYRKQRTDYLEQLANQLRESVILEKREKVVTSLKSWERRVIHLLLKDDKEVVTESQGSGRDRVLLIKPR